MASAASAAAGSAVGVSRMSGENFVVLFVVNFVVVLFVVEVVIIVVFEGMLAHEVVGADVPV